MNTPNIRFKGFSGDWEKRKFGDVFQEYSEKKHDELPPLMIMQGSGTILRDKSDRNLQYDKSSLSSYKMVKKNDFIVHLRSFEGGLEKANSEGIISPAYHTFHGDNTDTRFYYPFFRSQHFIDVLLKPHVYGIRDGKSIDINGMKTIRIPVPSYEEQQKIGNYIEQMDNLTIFHQRKCDSLKQVKKYMLQKMFPKQGEKVPEIRFAGFNGDWEQRKYSDIATTRRGLTYKPDNIVIDGKRVLRSSNINEDIFEIHEDDVFVDENAVNIPYVKNGDILITSANGSSRLVGKHAIVRNITDNSMVHGGFMLLASSDEPEFLNALMSSQWYTRFINVYVAGGNGAIGNLNKSDLDGQIVLVPSRDEMKKIGDYFSNLDTLITLHQRKSDSFKEIKKFMLQNMFPRE